MAARGHEYTKEEYEQMMRRILKVPYSIKRVWAAQRKATREMFNLKRPMA